jgi:DNA polymerase
VIIYEGQNQTTKKWEDIEIYGGKLVENIVQAIARDCLAVTIMRLEKLGYPIVFHVHDEIIAEVPDNGTKTLEEVKGIFKKPIRWAEGLPLKGDGYVTKYYLKD